MKRNLRRVMSKALAGAMFVTSSFTGPMSVSAAESDSTDVAAVAEAADSAEADSFEVADDSNDTADAEVSDADATDSDDSNNDVQEPTENDAVVTPEEVTPENPEAVDSDVDSSDVNAEGDGDTAESTIKYKLYTVDGANNTLFENTADITFEPEVKKQDGVEIGQWIAPMKVTATAEDGTKTYGANDTNDITDMKDTPSSTNESGKPAYGIAQQITADTPMYAYYVVDGEDKYIRIADYNTAESFLNFKTTMANTSLSDTDVLTFKFKLRAEALGGNQTFCELRLGDTTALAVGMGGSNLTKNGSTLNGTEVGSSGANHEKDLIVKAGKTANNGDVAYLTNEIKGDNDWHTYTIEIKKGSEEGVALAKVLVDDTVLAEEVALNGTYKKNGSIRFTPGSRINRVLNVKDVIVPYEGGSNTLDDYPAGTEKPPVTEVTEIKAFNYDGLIKMQANNGTFQSISKGTSEDVESITDNTVTLVNGKVADNFASALQADLRTKISAVGLTDAEKAAITVTKKSGDTYTITLNEKSKFDFDIKVAEATVDPDAPIIPEGLNNFSGAINFTVSEGKVNFAAGTNAKVATVEQGVIVLQATAKINEFISELLASFKEVGIKIGEVTYKTNITIEEDTSAANLAAVDTTTKYNIVVKDDAGTNVVAKIPMSVRYDANAGDTPVTPDVPTQTSGGIMVTSVKGVAKDGVTPDPNNLKQGDMVDVTYALEEGADINNYTFFVNWNSDVLEVQDVYDFTANNGAGKYLLDDKDSEGNADWITWEATVDNELLKAELIRPELIQNQLNIEPAADNADYKDLLGSTAAGAGVKARELGRIKLAGVAGLMLATSDEAEDAKGTNVSASGAGTLFTLRFKMLEEGGTADISIAPIAGKSTSADNGIFYEVPETNEAGEIQQSKPCNLDKEGEPFEVPKSQVTGEMGIDTDVTFDFTSDYVNISSNKAEGAEKASVSAKAGSDAEKRKAFISASNLAVKGGTEAGTKITLDGNYITAEDFATLESKFENDLKAAGLTVAKEGDTFTVSKEGSTKPIKVEFLRRDEIKVNVGFTYNGTGDFAGLKLVIAEGKVTESTSINGITIDAQGNITIAEDSALTVEALIQNIKDNTTGAEVTDANGLVTFKTGSDKFSIKVTKAGSETPEKEYIKFDYTYGTGEDAFDLTVSGSALGVDVKTTTPDKVVISGTNVQIRSDNLTVKALADDITAKVTGVTAATDAAADAKEGTITFTQDGKEDLSISVKIIAADAVLANIPETTVDGMKLTVTDGVADLTGDDVTSAGGIYTIKSDDLTVEKLIEDINTELAKITTGDGADYTAALKDGTTDTIVISKDGVEPVEIKVKVEPKTTAPTKKELTLKIGKKSADSTEYTDTIKFVSENGELTAELSGNELASTKEFTVDDKKVLYVPYLGVVDAENNETKQLTDLTADDFVVDGAEQADVTYEYDKAKRVITLTMGTGNSYTVQLFSYGDVNDDGRGNLNDALQIFAKLRGELTFDDIQNFLGNVNGDSATNLNDALKIFAKLRGETTLPSK